MGLSAIFPFGILINAPSFAKAVFSVVNDSSLLAIWLKYVSKTNLYFGFVKTEDNKQTSIPSCVVEDKNELNFPSINTSLCVSTSCKKYFFTSLNSIVFSFFGKTLKSFFNIEFSEVYFQASSFFDGKPLFSKFFIATFRVSCKLEFSSNFSSNVM